MSFRKDVGLFAGGRGSLIASVRKTALLVIVGFMALACGGTERVYPPGDGGGTGGAGGSAGAGGRKDAGPDSADSAGSGGSSSNQDAGDASVNDADIPDVVEEPQPPPPPGKPGTAVVAGGLKMKSSNYSAVVISGETPGWNGVLKSPQYMLHGGVVGTTQRK
jgi:hypothetical protein